MLKNMKIFDKFWGVSTLSLLWLIPNQPLTAQIVPDGSLQKPTLVTPSGNIFRIEGGMNSGTNLFHSFQEFSVPTGSTAYFDNAPNIQNIFSRVTGQSISNIDGLIGANGTANLFLLNPNGIIFGPNARLNIGGSFLATTADSIVFSDRTLFSATTPQASPLLTISVPIGLQFGQNPGAIRVIGTGHSFLRPDPLFGATEGGDRITGLQVIPGTTLALMGGELSLTGGTVGAFGGNVELGSVGEGLVSLNPAPNGWSFDYTQVSNFRDIQLSQLAAAYIIGNGGNLLRVWGRNISLSDGSQIIIGNIGLQPASQLNLNASEEIAVVGTAPDLRIRTTIGGTGYLINLNLNAKRLTIRDGAAVSANTFSAGPAGNITINTSESVEVSGFSPINPAFFSFLGTPTFSSGQGGDITISTQQLRILAGGAVTSLTLGMGNAGDVTVNASEVEVSGFEPTFVQPSALTSSTFNAGNAGNLRVNTSRLVLKNGGTLSGSTLAAGNAGSVTVNASDSVEVNGVVRQGDSFLVANITSSADIVISQAFRQRFGLPPVPSGASADVTINTRNLVVEDLGLVAVRNFGSGNAGVLRINAEKVVVADSADYAGITATTASGEGGNIVLNTENLELRKGGHITATAGGTGNGGNLTINADTIVALEHSEITANAFRGRGGNIEITTQGIFRSPDSNITASSQFGVSGIVQINTPDVDTTAGLVTLPENFTDVGNQIAAGCPADRGNHFVVTGRGGLPADPSQSLIGRAVWRDVRPVAAQQQGSRRAGERSPITHTPSPIIEATGWVMNNKGQVELVANTPNSTSQSAWYPRPDQCNN